MVVGKAVVSITFSAPIQSSVAAVSDVLQLCEFSVEGLSSVVVGR